MEGKLTFDQLGLNFILEWNGPKYQFGKAEKLVNIEPVKAIIYPHPHKNRIYISWPDHLIFFDPELNLLMPYDNFCKLISTENGVIWSTSVDEFKITYHVDTFIYSYHFDIGMEFGEFKNSFVRDNQFNLINERYWIRGGNGLEPSIEEWCSAYNCPPEFAYRLDQSAIRYIFVEHVDFRYNEDSDSDDESGQFPIDFRSFVEVGFLYISSKIGRHIGTIFAAFVVFLLVAPVEIR